MAITYGHEFNDRMRDVCSHCQQPAEYIIDYDLGCAPGPLGHAVARVVMAVKRMWRRS